ncbi:hypothetical protein MRX96_044652, partial [Rhipicephalus microplus]
MSGFINFGCPNGVNGGADLPDAFHRAPPEPKSRANVVLGGPVGRRRQGEDRRSPSQRGSNRVPVS